MRRWCVGIIGAGLVAHLCISLVSISRWCVPFISSYLITLSVPPENRIFVLSPAEYRAILFIRQELPPDARILWVPQISPMVNCYIYPRGIYQLRQFQPGEEVSVPAGFLKEKRITHVFFDYGRLYPVDRLTIRQQKENVILSEP